MHHGLLGISTSGIPIVSGLTAAALTVIVLQTVMPFLTVNYGVLRTFTHMELVGRGVS